MNSIAQPRVVIFCDHLLYPSETFIRAQAEMLQRFAPIYAGSRRVSGLDLPAESTYTISDGKFGGRIREAAFKLFGTAPALAKTLRALNPVLMHAHFGSDGLRALPLARRLGLPLVVTFHGSDATAIDLEGVKVHYGHRRYLKQRRKLQLGATLFLTVSEFIRTKLLEQGFPEQRILVHHIGVDTNLFAPRNSEQNPMVLFVGRLVECKGASYLIRAMAEIQKEKPDAELVVIGDGPMRKELQQQAKDALRRFRFLGTQPSEVVREWMNRASIVSVPSVKMLSGQEEAFGIVFAEAQAMEKPVVSFASGGIGEAVEHGETGFLAAERDWRGLAEYLSLLLNSPEMRRKFGVAGRKRVIRLFDLYSQTAALETIYDSVMKHSASPVSNLARELAQQEN